MGRKRTPGLYKRRGNWHIDKRVFGQRILCNTETSSLQEAEAILANYIDKLREAKLYGVRPSRTFRTAAVKYLKENQHKRSIADDAMHLKQLEPFIGSFDLDQIHMGTLQPFIQARKSAGIKSKSINNALGVVRLILNLAATEWLDESCLTWLQTAPKIKMLPTTDKRDPYPISWIEQNRLFTELPEHLRNMAMFKVNTGTREQEVCQLHWSWEVKVPALNTSVFLIPSFLVKNQEERLVVLNNAALQVIEQMRGRHPEYVFTYRGNPLTCMNNTAWKSARKRAGLSQVRVHDLKHTFGRRLRAAGVSFEDRQDLLGHKSGRITTHYSSAELQNLILAANKVVAPENGGPSLSLIRNLGGNFGGASFRQSSAREGLNIKRRRQLKVVND